MVSAHLSLGGSITKNYLGNPRPSARPHMFVYKTNAMSPGTYTAGYIIGPGKRPQLVVLCPDYLYSYI